MTYTRITQTYGYVRDIPGYFEDVPYINHMDAVFAKYYFDAYDNYQSRQPRRRARGLADRVRRGPGPADDRHR